MVAAEDTLQVLTEQVRHRFPATRLRAVKTLGKMGAEASAALPALTTALDDADSKVREAAAAAVGQMGPEAVQTLGAMLSHPDKYIRRHAVWALGKLGPPAVPMRHRLCQVLKDEDPRTASGAAQALGALGDLATDCIPALAEAMRGTNIVLCRLAAKALSQIGKPALATLIQHLKHHDPFVQSEAAVALGWMGAKAVTAVPILIELLRSPPAGSVAKGSAPVGMAGTPPTGVSTKISDQQTSLDAARANAAQALGRMGSAAIAALTALEHARTDAIDAVKQAAELSVRQIRGEA